jgi:hypothetical protein
MTFKIKHPSAKLFIVTVISISISMLGFVVNESPSESVRQELEATNYQLIKAHTESPAIQIYVDTPSALIEKAQLINTTVIYDTNKGFVVYDSAQNIGYYYTTHALWFNIPFETTVILTVLGISLLPIIITSILIVKYGED